MKSPISGRLPRSFGECETRLEAAGSSPATTNLRNIAMSSTAPFITGSHAYGSPTENSDIDLVVWAVGETRAKLEVGGYPIRFGRLNLILISDSDQWDIWKIGTEALVKLSKSRKSAVSRDEAVAFFITLGVTQEPNEEPYSKETRNE